MAAEEGGGIADGNAVSVTEQSEGAAAAIPPPEGHPHLTAR